MVLAQPFAAVETLQRHEVCGVERVAWVEWAMPKALGVDFRTLHGTAGFLAHSPDMVKLHDIQARCPSVWQSTLRGIHASPLRVWGRFVPIRALSSQSAWSLPSSQQLASDPASTRGQIPRSWILFAATTPPVWESLRLCDGPGQGLRAEIGLDLSPWLSSGQAARRRRGVRTAPRDSRRKQRLSG